MNLVKRVNPVALGLGAAGLAGTASGLVGSLAKSAARGLARTAASGDEEVEAPRDRSASPTVVLAEPHAPDEPPVDVVGMALAAEAEAESGAAVAHEPRAASREEEHGAALQRTTVEEIVDETAAALEGDVDLEPHLTAPVLDASDTKAAMAELATMSRASDPHKG